MNIIVASAGIEPNLNERHPCKYSPVRADDDNDDIVGERMDGRSSMK